MNLQPYVASTKLPTLPRDREWISRDSNGEVWVRLREKSDPVKWKALDDHDKRYVARRCEHHFLDEADEGERSIEALAAANAWRAISGGASRSMGAGSSGASGQSGQLGASGQGGQEGAGGFQGFSG